MEKSKSDIFNINSHDHCFMFVEYRFSLEKLIIFFSVFE